MKIYIGFFNQECEGGGCLVLSSCDASNCASYIEHEVDAHSAIENALKAQIHAKMPELDAAKVRNTAEVYIAVMLRSNLSKKGVVSCANAYLSVIRGLFPHVIVRSW